MNSLGVYLHFPWCLAKCPYCDFASYPATREEIPHERYADAIVRELAERASALEQSLATIFIGGGTPSLWSRAALGRVLAAVRSTLAPRDPADPPVEITVECNPSSFDERAATELLEVGVNRVSIGVQSLDQERLTFLGRLHDASGAVAALRAAERAGFKRISADLIFGVEGGKPQSPADAAREARAVAELGLTHVSAYGLTIEPGTAFGELHRKGRLPIAPDERIVDSFFAIEEVLESFGLEHYEISNYARPGEESRHNLGYWRGHDYLGLGVSAVGCVNARRYKNQKDPGRYLRAVLEARGPLEMESEDLDPETRLRERIMLGLRLRDGFDLEAAARELGIERAAREREPALARLVKLGRVERDGTRVRVARHARALTDGIAADLF
ncbi:MAG: radical SAM family heme chaperone HemW [Polyangiaceae bacterium]